MKKIISRYYLFVAILLIIADQFFIRLVLHSDLAAGLSDFGYYFSDMMLNFLVVLLALVAMIWSGKWQQINSRKFKVSYLFYFFLALLAFLFGISLPFLFSRPPKMKFLINWIFLLLQVLLHF